MNSMINIAIHSFAVGKHCIIIFLCVQPLGVRVRLLVDNDRFRDPYRRTVMAAVFAGHWELNTNVQLCFKDVYIYIHY